MSMLWRAWRGMSVGGCRSWWLVAAACALTLCACTTDGQTTALGLQPRSATVAFESIDGPPSGQFYKLVQNLNDEAQAHQLAVISRERPAAYHVRGYLAAKVVKGRTTIAWVWDVFDANDRRALRISGEEAASGRHHDAWAAADDAMLHRIARTSTDQLAGFLISPDATAQAAPAPTTIAEVGQESSPEAAGIFRIFHAQADPMPGGATASPAAAAPLEAVPLPRRKPTLAAAMSTRETVSLASSSQ
jgi:hypothetical protein